MQPINSSSATLPFDSVNPNSGTQSASSAQNPAAAAKLHKSAGEFESLLLSSLWKSMKNSFESSDSENADAAHGTIEDWGIEIMSGAVGKAGGLGLGKLIEHQLGARLSNSQNGTTPQAAQVSPARADIHSK